MTVSPIATLTARPETREELYQQRKLLRRVDASADVDEAGAQIADFLER